MRLCFNHFADSEEMAIAPTEVFAVLLAGIVRISVSVLPQACRMR